MNILSIFESIKEPVSKIIDKIPDVNQKREIESEIMQVIVKAELAVQDYVTNRQKLDMASDSWLAKNIRPMSLIFILFMYTSLSLADGNIDGFEVNAAYVELLGQWGITIMSFYFGGRTFEKAAGVFGGLRKK